MFGNPYLVWRTDYGTYLEKLIDFGSAREERPECINLYHDTPNGPYIDGAAVACTSQKHFWRTIPEYF